MSKYRLVYVFSLLLLGTLVVFTIFRPIAFGEKYSEVSREHLLKTENEQIIEFDIMNREGEAKKYTFNVLMNGELYSEDALIPDGGTYTHIHHIYPDQLTDRNVIFTVYKEGEDTPFEQITYYID